MEEHKADTMELNINCEGDSGSTATNATGSNYYILDTLSSFPSCDYESLLSFVGYNNEIAAEEEDDLVPEATEVSSTEDEIFEESIVIGSMEGFEASTCPCCSRLVMDEHRKICALPETSQRHVPPVSLLSQEPEIEEEDKLFGTLNTDDRYDVKKVLSEGWLHKKGTGNDWFWSTAWKPRWAQLVLADVQGYDVQVPLLLMYWYPTSPMPSTVLSLDSTVVFPIDRKEDDSDEKVEEWNKHCFNILHARARQEDAAFNDQEPITRTFTAPPKERDQWMHAISKALLHFEKSKAAHALGETNGPGHTRWHKFVYMQNPEEDKLEQINPYKWSGERAPLPRSPP